MVRGAHRRWLSLLAPALLLAACAGALRPWPGRGARADEGLPTTAVLLPFLNLGEAASARAAVMPKVRQQLERAGYTVAPEAEVEAFLEQRRIRYLDALEPAQLAAVRDQFDAGWVVTGGVLTWRDGPAPVVAVEARLWSVNGRTAWWNVAGLTSEDTSGVFELGRLDAIGPLLDEAVRGLMSTLPPPGARAKTNAPRPMPTVGAEPQTWRGGLWPTAPVKVCVLPLENSTTDKRASWIAAELLSRRLAESGRFTVVSPAELRAAVTAERALSLWAAGAGELRQVGKRLGTSLFLRGSVQAFRDATARAEDTPPEVQLDVTLVDVERDRILWTGQHRRVGDEYEIAFGKGALREVVMLTDQVAGELVRAEGYLAEHPLPLAVVVQPSGGPRASDAGSSDAGTSDAGAPDAGRAGQRGDGGPGGGGAARDAGPGTAVDGSTR